MNKGLVNSCKLAMRVIGLNSMLKSASTEVNSVTSQYVRQGQKSGTFLHFSKLWHFVPWKFLLWAMTNFSLLVLISSAMFKCWQKWRSTKRWRMMHFFSTGIMTAFLSNCTELVTLLYQNCRSMHFLGTQYSEIDWGMSQSIHFITHSKEILELINSKENGQMHVKIVFLYSW